MKKTMLLLSLAAMGAYAAVGDRVTSKQGGVELRRTQEGAVICTAPFGEEMQVLRQEADQALVKALCAKGWVPLDQLQKVAAPVGDRTVRGEEVVVTGSSDNPFLTDVNGGWNLGDVPEITITRDFKDFLTHTVDRESQERAHGEN